MSIWLAVYLIGWAGLSGYGVSDCARTQGGHGMTEPVCHTLVVISGAAWPAFAVGGAYYAIKEM